MVALPLLTPELLEQITEAILRSVAPEQIVLFGSRAKGLNQPDSDIDFLIVEAEPLGLNRSRRKEPTKVWKALSPFGISVDVLMLSTEEETKWQHSRNHIIVRVIAKGKVLYERSFLKRLPPSYKQHTATCKP
ncbi:nucleotidyltransferase domain-containing protein [Nodosilinea sp. LEGE 07298]|uniref:nucleotidyltransferase domain-containing protein n=1 Tax=Nodosilinea sp. LEGE 07298 TaxID=2777970 RepID=UPI001882C3F3|nr:nucleotidyltransferase domain-containing protein [Nodosilinea sp. LEGE 07298]MBE9111912.1 nucleotidyltransferase domain-containing protein [Nodosilinea sp. LEGE 07298]